MATYTIDLGQRNSGDCKDWSTTFTKSDINSKINSNTSAYANFSKVWFKCKAAKTDSLYFSDIKVTVNGVVKLDETNIVQTSPETYEGAADLGRDGYHVSLDITDAFSSRSIKGDIKVDIEAYWTAVANVKYYLFSPRLEIEYSIPNYTITTKTSGSGSVTGGKSYQAGSSCTLTATPSTGYKFVKWSEDGSTSNPRTFTVTGNATYTAVFEKKKYTVNFKNQDNSTIKTISNIEYGTTIGTAFGGLPTITREGYAFAGWIPCAPAKKTDGTVLDSYQYTGSNAYPLDTKYKYTDKFSLHIEAYMPDWVDIKNRQIISCTESGGWGLGFQANANGNGFEVKDSSGYKGIDLGFGTDWKFNNSTWHSFDIVFLNGKAEAFVDGISKGSCTLSSSTIAYNSSNTIFVGAEAGTTLTTPASGYFKGYISNVFIANQGTRLTTATTSTVVDGNIDYYPIWRKLITPDINYDNLFSLSNWANSASGKLNSRGADNMVIDNENGTIRIKENGGTNSDIYTTYGGANNHYHIQVSPNTKYYIHLTMTQNTSGSLGQFFVFYYTDSGSNANTAHSGWRKDINGELTANGDYIFDFTTPSNCTNIGLRFGIYSSYADITYSNIKIYKNTDIYNNFISKISNYKARDLKTLSSFYSPSITGYDFKGWYENEDLSGNAIIISAVKNILYGKTVYSKWTAKTPLVTFDPNGGSVPQTSKSVIYGQSYGELPTPTKEHYNFNGWYYNGAKITASTTVTKETSHSLVASWIPKIYTLIYDVRGGTIGSTSKKVEYGSKYGELLTPEKTGHAFDGWWTAADGGDRVSSETIMTKDNQIIYAHWTVNKYTITFDGNGADNTGAMIAQQFSYGETKKLTKNVFTKEFHNFVNWKDEVGKEYADEEEICNLTNEDGLEIVLYAQWELDFVGKITIGENSYQVVNILIDTDKVVDKIYVNKMLSFMNKT